jgi:CHAD domain-containing protein
MTTLRQAAEQALEALEGADMVDCNMRDAITALQKALAQREWVGLTDEEIYDFADKFLYQHGSNYGIRSFGKAVEAKLKEKNT